MDRVSTQTPLKRFLALFTVLAMCFSLLPLDVFTADVFADDPDPVPDPEPTQEYAFIAEPQSGSIDPDTLKYHVTWETNFDPVRAEIVCWYKDSLWFLHDEKIDVGDVGSQGSYDLDKIIPKDVYSFSGEYTLSVFYGEEERDYISSSFTVSANDLGFESQPASGGLDPITREYTVQWETNFVPAKVAITKYSDGKDPLAEVTPNGKTGEYTFNSDEQIDYYYLFAYWNDSGWPNQYVKSQYFSVGLGYEFTTQPTGEKCTFLPEWAQHQMLFGLNFDVSQGGITVWKKGDDSEPVTAYEYNYTAKYGDKPIRYRLVPGATYYMRAEYTEGKYIYSDEFVAPDFTFRLLRQPESGSFNDKNDFFVQADAANFNYCKVEIIRKSTGEIVDTYTPGPKLQHYSREFRPVWGEEYYLRIYYDTGDRDFIPSDTFKADYKNHKITVEPQSGNYDAETDEFTFTFTTSFNMASYDVEYYDTASDEWKVIKSKEFTYKEKTATDHVGLEYINKRLRVKAYFPKKNDDGTEGVDYRTTEEFRGSQADVRFTQQPKGYQNYPVIEDNFSLSWATDFVPKKVFIVHNLKEKGNGSYDYVKDVEIKDASELKKVMGVNNKTYANDHYFFPENSVVYHVIAYHSDNSFIISDPYVYDTSFMKISYEKKAFIYDDHNGGTGIAYYFKWTTLNTFYPQKIKIVTDYRDRTHYTTIKTLTDLGTAPFDGFTDGFRPTKDVDYYILAYYGSRDKVDFIVSDRIRDDYSEDLQFLYGPRSVCINEQNGFVQQIVFNFKPKKAQLWKDWEMGSGKDQIGTDITLFTSTTDEEKASLGIGSGIYAYNLALGAQNGPGFYELRAYFSDDEYISKRFAVITPPVFTDQPDDGIMTTHYYDDDYYYAAAFGIELSPPDYFEVLKKNENDVFEKYNGDHYIYAEWDDSHEALIYGPGEYMIRVQKTVRKTPTSPDIFHVPVDSKPFTVQHGFTKQPKDAVTTFKDGKKPTISWETSFTPVELKIVKISGGVAVDTIEIDDHTATSSDAISEEGIYRIGARPEGSDRFIYSDTFHVTILAFTQSPESGDAPFDSSYYAYWSATAEPSYYEVIYQPVGNTNEDYITRVNVHVPCYEFTSTNKWEDYECFIRAHVSDDEFVDSEPFIVHMQGRKIDIMLNGGSIGVAMSGNDMIRDKDYIKCDDQGNLIFPECTIVPPEGYMFKCWGLTDHKTYAYALMENEKRGLSFVTLSNVQTQALEFDTWVAEHDPGEGMFAGESIVFPIWTSRWNSWCGDEISKECDGEPVTFDINHVLSPFIPSEHFPYGYFKVGGKDDGMGDKNNGKGDETINPKEPDITVRILDKDSGEYVDSETTITPDANALGGARFTVTGSSEEGSYKVEFVKDGSVILSRSFNIGGAMPKRPDIWLVSSDFDSLGSVIDIPQPSEEILEGSDVILKAPTVPGYKFLGWYKVQEHDDTNVTELGEPVCEKLEYRFTCDGSDIIYTAVYKSIGNANVTIYTKNGAEISIDGYYSDKGKEDPYGKGKDDFDDKGKDDEPMSFPVPLGTELTIRAADPDKVLQWENESGKVLGTSDTLVLTVVRDMEVTLVYKNEEKGATFVQFVSDYGQIILADTYNEEKRLEELPTPPSKLGFTFVNWAIDGDENQIVDEASAINELIGTVDMLTVKPIYTKDTDIFTVTVAYSGVERDSDIYTDIPKGEGYTVTAPEIDGYIFSCWKRGETIVSYKRSYYILVSDNIELTAEYVTADTEVKEAEPVIILEKPFATEVSGKHKVSCKAVRSVPETYTVVEVGMLYAGNTSLEKDEFVIGANGVRKYVSKETTRNGSIVLNVSVSDVTMTVYFRGYMILKNDETGNTDVYYTDDINYASYSGLTAGE